MDHENTVLITPIAHIRTDFHEKFGIPRQSCLVPELRARIEFEEEYADPNAIRGIEEYNYLWLIFGFSESRVLPGDPWMPIVHPPRLGGKVGKGVFATRSPYRPNSLGLSSVRLIEVDRTDPGHPALIVGGADLLDGTPVYDIKPYMVYGDSHPDAGNGFAYTRWKTLEVDFPEELLAKIGPAHREAVVGVLAQDPRGAYEKKPGYVFGMNFAEYDIRFTVEGETLTVVGVEPREAEKVK
ncbi:MAG: tRNA (N6-threonylcarbamoyladenosine(37)-N6)-methyltransferase TrmO [Mogibacterium sp.]|nr:tRNA (N6-threonylcarbamoyladenosine(37)-N6)-methyltransferase TrmO [Mogibacterium sp.]